MPKVSNYTEDLRSVVTDCSPDRRDGQGETRQGSDKGRPEVGNYIDRQSEVTHCDPKG